uniref:protease complex subunit PrcB family protein n=1 Tax=Trichocoleus desertorum TaxID=1481672 RepID=UPI0025B3B7B2|nr:protease complex subunit PrcB family protein [Trichocoleus desertorum]
MPIPFCLREPNFLRDDWWVRLLILGFAIALVSCTPAPVPVISGTSGSPRASATPGAEPQIAPSSSTPTKLPDALPSEIATNSSVSFQILPIERNPLSTRSISESQLLVFRNQQEWANFWNSDASPDANPKKTVVPVVDFSHQQAIAVTLGSRPTGGFSIQIDQIEKLEAPQSQEWVVRYTEKVPGADCFVTQQTTTPTVFLLTAASDVPIRMQGKTLTDSCNR